MLQEHARFPADLNAALRGRLVEKIHVFHVPPEGRKSLMERAAACGALEMVTSFAENLEFYRRRRQQGDRRAGPERPAGAGAGTGDGLR